MEEKINSEFEKLTDLEKKERLDQVLQQVRKMQPEHYEDKIHNEMERDNFSHNFSKRILRTINGESWLGYLYRNESDIHENLKNSEHRFSPEDINKEVANFIESKTRDNLVLDLGAGVDGTGYAIADSLGAGGYIGSEFNFADSLNNRIEDMDGETPHVIAQGDMGDLLNKFPDFDLKPKVIIFSGIDRISYEGKLIGDELLKSIYDSLDDDVVLLFSGNNQDIEDYKLADPGNDPEKMFEEVKFSEGVEFEIYKKRL